MLSPLPRVLRAVIRRGRKRLGLPGSILRCPRASEGAALPRPTRETFSNPCPPCPKGKRPPTRSKCTPRVGTPGCLPRGTGPLGGLGPPQSWTSPVSRSVETFPQDPSMPSRFPARVPLTCSSAQWTGHRAASLDSAPPPPSPPPHRGANSGRKL